MTTIAIIIAGAVLAFGAYKIGTMVGYDRGWARANEIHRNLSKSEAKQGAKVEAVAVKVKSAPKEQATAKKAAKKTTTKAAKKSTKKATKTSKAKKTTKRGPGRPRKNS